MGRCTKTTPAFLETYEQDAADALDSLPDDFEPDDAGSFADELQIDEDEVPY